MLLRVRLAIAVLLFVVLCVALRLGMLPLVMLLVLLGLLLRLLRIHVLPGIAAVVVFLPARAGVLIHAAIVTGIHIATGVLACVGVSISTRSCNAVAALRALDCTHAPLSRRIVLRFCRFIALLNIRLAPLRGRAGSLVSRAICSGVRVVSLTGTALCLPYGVETEVPSLYVPV